MHSYTVNCGDLGLVSVNVNGDFSGDAILSWYPSMPHDVAVTGKARIDAGKLLRGEVEELATTVPSAILTRTVAWMVALYITDQLRSFADTVWLPKVPPAVDADLVHCAFRGCAAPARANVNMGLCSTHAVEVRVAVARGAAL